MLQQPLRIAIATALYAPFLSGISIGVHQRVSWFLQQGHEVFLIHPQINNQFSANVSKCVVPGISEFQHYPNFRNYAYPTEPMTFNKSHPNPLSYQYWDDTQLLEDFKPDIILLEEAAHMRGMYSFNLRGYGRPVAVEYASKTGVPTISFFHTDIASHLTNYLGDQAFSLFSPLLSMFIEQFSQTYNLTLFPSKTQLIKYKTLKYHNSEYFPFQGVDCEKFNPKNIVYNPIPNDDKPIILFVGRIAAEKNVAQLFEIYSIVAKKIKDVRLVIVGSGDLLGEIKQRAQELASGVTVWGESHGEELLGWYARADVFVNPSITETFCTTNSEALASGTPVIAADSPSTIEQITSGYNGLIAKPKNTQDFANRIIQLLENVQLKKQMSDNARSSALQLDWTACMEKLESKLYQVVGEFSKN